MGEGDERRQHERIPVRDQFKVRFRDADRMRNVHVRDISAGGMFIRSQNPREPGTPVELLLETADGTQIPLTGRIAHAVEPSADARGGNGVQFTELTDDSRAKLVEYLQGLGEGVATDDEIDIDIDVDDGQPESMIDEGLSFEVLLNLEDQLVELERHVRSNAYEALGVEYRASEADIRVARDDRLGELALTGYDGPVPISLVGRIERVSRGLSKAVDLLADPQARAALDIELGLLVPRRSEVRSAFRDALRQQREQVSDDQKSELTRAAPFVAMANQKNESGDLGAARTLFRMALLYDPFDVDIRQRLATVETKLKIGHD